jgi:hypothetical protein
MRREELYLTDILEAADAIQRFIQGIEREDFFGDELHQSAVLQKQMTQAPNPIASMGTVIRILGPK